MKWTGPLSRPRFIWCAGHVLWITRAPSANKPAPFASPLFTALLDSSDSTVTSTVCVTAIIISEKRRKITGETIVYDRYARLDNSDREEALAFISRRPELNIILLYNIQMFGMDQGDTPFHGDYFGLRDDSGLIAAGVLFNLGSLFFYAVEDEAIEGMADYMLDLGRVPSFMNGKASHFSKILEGLSGKLDYTFSQILTDQMALRGSVQEGVDTECARPSRMSDIATLVEKQVALEEELFGGASMDDVSLRELLSWQVRKGAASVAEREGLIVSKAEATVLKGTGAQVGGVFTRPAFRGRGFSTACVADLCKRVLNEVDLVALSVEKENLASHRVYQKIGFQKVDDWMIVALRPKSSSRENRPGPG